MIKSIYFQNKIYFYSKNIETNNLIFFNIYLNKIFNNQDWVIIFMKLK